MIKEQIVIGKDTKYPLNGLLTLPTDTKAPVPAVVFVHGSGASNMDEKVGKLTPFKDLAEGLAKHGIASIRYDKRTFAHGRKMVKNKGETVTVKEETIEDAILATEILRKDSRIDSDKIFIVGHSMGAMLAPRIDAEGGEYKGIILLAGTPRKLEEVMVDQTQEIVSSMNRFMQKMLEKRVKKLASMFEGLYDMPDEEAKRKKIGGGVTLYYFKEMGEHDTADYLTDLKKPLLVMQGDKDCQVKLDKDFAAYRELLKDRTNVTFKVYEKLNHAFVPYRYGEIKKVMKEYTIEQHIGEEVIADIASWIKEAIA